MEFFFAHMTFLFLSSLAFLISFALCIHFDIYGMKTKLKNLFLSVFDVALPDGNDESTKELKLKMAKAATYITYAVIFVFLISIFLSFALPVSLSEDENKYTGPLGDLFNGLLTPLLTFLTFCGLLITIMIQNVQMKSTLQELELTRKEMAESTDALQEQVKNSVAQKFDSNFYEMLRFHLEVMKDYLSTSLADKEYSHINNHGKEWKSFICPDEIRRLSLINYQLLKFIRDNEKNEVIDENKAKNYANIVRATITEDIFGLFFVNVLQEKFEKSKELMEHYEFFEHLAFSKFTHPYVLKRISLYKKEAFGDELNLKKFYINRKKELSSFSLLEVRENYENFKRFSANAPNSIFADKNYSNDYPADKIKELEYELTSYTQKVENLKIEEIINDSKLFELFIACKADEFLIYLEIDKVKFYKNILEAIHLLKSYSNNYPETNHIRGNLISNLNELINKA